MGTIKNGLKQVPPAAGYTAPEVRIQESGVRINTRDTAQRFAFSSCYAKLSGFKKILALALIFVLLTGFIPAQSALAATETVRYLTENGEILPRDGVNVLDLPESALLEGKDLWYVLKGVNDGILWITVDGDIHLILENNCNWSIKQGIQITSGSSLTIYSQPVDTDIETGKLTVTGSAHSAGIGGGDGGNGGTITINGGNITSTGGTGGAGIGGGDGVEGGTITINGGDITSTGGTDSKGAGGGAGIWPPNRGRSPSR
jgi:hypothetical protein